MSRPRRIRWLRAPGGAGQHALDPRALRQLQFRLGKRSGRQLVRENGAHYALDHHAADFAEQISKLTGGAGVNIILEMLANQNLAKDLQMLSKFGSKS